PEQTTALATWYDGTRTWTGGHSFTPFLENIFKDLLKGYSLAGRKRLLEIGDKAPLPALVLVNRLQTDPQPELLPELNALHARLEKAPKVFKGAELRQAVEDVAARTALRHPSPETWPHLVRGLASKNPLLRSDVLRALRKLPNKPKADEAAPYRTV